MSDIFRVLRGLEIDNAAQILQGSAPPGSTSDTNAAPRGSLYLDTTAGVTYTKTAIGTGTGSWGNISVSPSILTAESLATPTMPIALGDNSIALGSGAQTTVTATGSLAIGSGSSARLPGGVVQASGQFSGMGDAQCGRYILRTITTDATLTQAFIDGPGGVQQLVLPNNSTWTVTVTITGHRTDVNDGHAGYKAEGVVYRNTGVATVAIQGTFTKTVFAESNTPWDISITTDPTTGALSVLVKGQAGKTIRWVCLIDTVEVTN
jgi:hypothetical protein